MRLSMGISIVAAITVLAVADGHAQPKWPTKNIRAVVGWPAGGSIDVMARALAMPLSEALGTSVTVDNKPGATGNIATLDTIRSPADGYTLLMAATYSQAVNPFLIKSSPNMAAELTPVAIIGKQKLYLAVRSDMKANTLQELVDLAKASPGKLNYASAGAGSPPHLTAELFKLTAGIDLTHIPYRGSAPALQAVLAKEADMVFDPGLSLQHIEGGKIKILGITSDKRPAKYPSIPKFSEAGVKGMDAADVWVGVWVKKGTPPEVIAQINKALLTALQQEPIRRRFEDITAEAIYMDSEKFNRLLENETKTMGTVIREKHITVE